MGGRRLLAVAVVVVLSALASLVTPGVANASTIPCVDSVCSNLSSSARAAMEADLTDVTYCDGTCTDTLTEGLQLGRVAGGVETVDAVGVTLGGYFIAAAAGYAAYKITSAVLGHTMYALFNPTHLSNVGTFDGYQWQELPHDPSCHWFRTGTYDSSIYDESCWQLLPHYGGSGYFNSFCDSPSTCAAIGYGVSHMDGATEIEGLPGINIFNRPDNLGELWAWKPAEATDCGGTITPGCGHLVQLPPGVSMHQGTAGEYGAADRQIDGGSSNDCDDTCLGRALKALHSGNASQQSPAQAAAVDTLGSDAGILNANFPDCSGLTTAACDAALSGAGFTSPGTYTTAPFPAEVPLIAPGAVVTQPYPAGTSVSLGQSPLPFETNDPDPNENPMYLPRPLQGETYWDYVARLRAIGYLGTITYIDLDNASGDPTLGPDGVPYVQVQVGTSGTPSRLPARGWPAPRPKIKRGISIIIERNPHTFPSVPTEPTPSNPNSPGPDPAFPSPAPGGPGVNPGTCGPSTPTLDFTPLQSINFGGKFPFGLFTWLGSALSPLVTGPVTPVFDVPINLPSVGNYSIHIDLSPANPYMSYFRLLMTIGLAIAAVTILASSVLGINIGNGGGGIDTSYLDGIFEDD